MQMQPQNQQPRGPSQRNLRPRRYRWIRLLIVILIIVPIAIVLVRAAWVFSSNSAISTFATLIISVLGLIIGIWQARNSPNSSDAGQVPEVKHPPFNQLPGMNPEMIKRQGDVDKICQMLEDPSISAIMFRGIYGIGKTNLAISIFNYAKQKKKGKKVRNAFFFKNKLSRESSIWAAKPIWLDINDIQTFQQFSDKLFSEYKKRRLEISHCLPQHQAVKVLKLLQGKPRLIVLEFTAPFHGQDPQFSLTNDPAFKEWLKALNSQPCDSRIILTDCPYIDGSCHELNPFSRVKEFYVKGLTEYEAMDFISKSRPNAAEQEIDILVNYFGTHPGALSNISNFLLQNNTIKVVDVVAAQYDGMQAPRWEKEIYEKFVESDYRRLTSIDQEVLRSFAIYRRSVSFEGGFTMCSHLGEVDVRIAVHKLINLDLMQDENGQYHVPALIAKCALTHCDNSSSQTNQMVRRALHDKAAQYYLNIVQNSRSSGVQQNQQQIRQIAIAPFLFEAVWHSFGAGKEEEGWDLVKRENLSKFMDLIFHYK